MSETPLEKIVRLAAFNVRGFQRVERGRSQYVRPHASFRNGEPVVKENGSGLEDIAAEGIGRALARTNGPDRDIPESKWKAGQQEWKSKGEADWRARFAQHLHHTIHAHAGLLKQLGDSLNNSDVARGEAGWQRQPPR